MIEIKKAGLEHASILSEIGTKSFIESHGNSGPLADIEAYAADKLTPEAFENDLQQETNLYYMIYVDDQPAGYSKIILNTAHPEIPEKEVSKLERLYLLRQFYGHNLGAQLFDFNVKLSKEAGQKGLWLYVWKGNERAIRFYEKQGFQITGSFDFLISPTHTNPNHLMLLRS